MRPWKQWFCLGMTLLLGSCARVEPRSGVIGAENSTVPFLTTNGLVPSQIEANRAFRAFSFSHGPIVFPTRYGSSHREAATDLTVLACRPASFPKRSAEERMRYQAFCYADLLGESNSLLGRASVVFTQAGHDAWTVRFLGMREPYAR